jgi:hypothetical protein
MRSFLSFNLVQIAPLAEKRVFRVFIFDKGPKLYIEWHKVENEAWIFTFFHVFKKHVKKTSFFHEFYDFWTIIFIHVPVEIALTRKHVFYKNDDFSWILWFLDMHFHTHFHVFDTYFHPCPCEDSIDKVCTFVYMQKHVSKKGRFWTYFLQTWF